MNMSKTLAATLPLSVGIVKPQFGFDPANKLHEVPFMIRTVHPFASLMAGYSTVYDFSADQKANPESDVDGIDGDVDVLDNTAATTTPLYALTPMSTAFSDRVWLHLDNYLRSGAGARHNVTFSDAIRYLARVNFITNTVRSILNLTYLADNRPWAEDSDAAYSFERFITDIGLLDPAVQQQFNHILKQAADLPAFPNMVQESIRILEPFKFSAENDVIIIPQSMPWSEASVTVTSQLDLCQNYLTYIRGSLEGTVSTLQMFIPTTLRDAGIFSEPVITLDPIKASGYYNAHPESLNVFGNNTSPDDDENNIIQIDNYVYNSDVRPGGVIQSDLSEIDGIEFDVRNEETAAAEFVSSTVYLEERSQTPDRFSLLTPHQWTNVVLFKPLDNSYVVVDGTNLSASYDHLTTLMNLKHPGISDEVRRMPGYKSCSLEVNAAMEAILRFTEVTFHIDEMASIAHAQMGRGVRFARPEIKEIFLGMS